MKLKCCECQRDFEASQLYAELVAKKDLEAICGNCDGSHADDADIDEAEYRYEDR